MCGVGTESLLDLFRIAGRRLVHRHQGGSLTVVGVRAKHIKLRGWIDPPLRADCGPDRTGTGSDQTETETETEKGPDQTGSDPRGGGYDSRSRDDHPSKQEQIAAVRERLAAEQNTPEAENE
jgi:hypothetical protein